MAVKHEVIVLYESLTESVMSDLVTFAMITSVIGVGWFLQSAVAEVVGWFAVCVYIISSVLMANHQSKMTPQEAADWLKAEFGVNAH